LESVRVHQELTTLYILEYNGVVDRDNKIVVESVCYMIHAKNMSLRFWGQAIQKNKLHFPKPNILHFQNFRSDSFVHIPKEF
jgi:hypothetical protein